MNKIFFVVVISAFLFVLSINGQKKAVKKLDYTTAEKSCVTATDTEKWASAETLCKSALILAKALPEDRKAEKMRAFQNYGFTLFSQYKFQLALDNWEKSFEIGKSFLSESDADLAYAYLNLGRANQGLANLEKAVEFYEKSGQIYRAAYENEIDSELKKKHKESIKRTLLLQRYIAGYLNNNDMFDRIEKKIADLKELKD